MKLIATIGLILIFYITPAKSEEYFKDCSAHASEKNYAPLLSYLKANQIDADKCQQLNKGEFLFTNESNFNFCRLSEVGEMTCHETQSGRYYPNLTLLERFVDSDGKQFVLFKTSGMSRGYFGSGFQVFYLTPKTENARGYVILDLHGVGDSYVSNGGSGAYCNPEITPETDENQTFINPASLNMIQNSVYEIIKDENGRTVLQFNQDQIDCRKKLKSKEIVQFIWDGHNFQKKVAPNLETVKWDQ